MKLHLHLTRNTVLFKDECVLQVFHALLQLLDVFVVQVNDAKEIKNTEIAKELSLPPVKLHCSSKLQSADQ